MWILAAGFVTFGEVQLFCLFLKIPFFRCSSNINLESSITPRCFGNDDWEALVLLNTNRGLYIYFALRLKITSRACFLGSIWIKVHFPLKGPVIYYFQIFIEIICRFLSVMYNRKQRNIIWKQLCIGSETFCKISNVNQK